MQSAGCQKQGAGVDARLHCMGMGAKQKDLCDLQWGICTLLILFENLFTEMWNFLHTLIENPQ